MHIKLIDDGKMVYVFGQIELLEGNIVQVTGTDESNGSMYELFLHNPKLTDLAGFDTRMMIELEGHTRPASGTGEAPRPVKIIIT